MRVRNAWELGRIPGAHNIPLDELADAVLMLEEQRRAITFVCRDGHRSAIAAELIGRRGSIAVTSLAGGLMAWLEAGLSIDREGGERVA